MIAGTMVLFCIVLCIGLLAGLPTAAIAAICLVTLR